MGRATLAQLVERLIRNQQVAGSIPAGGSRNFLKTQDFLEALQPQVPPFWPPTVPKPLHAASTCARTLFVVCLAVQLRERVPGVAIGL